MSCQGEVRESGSAFTRKPRFGWIFIYMVHLGSLVKRSSGLGMTCAPALAQARVKLRNSCRETRLDLLCDENFPYRKLIP
jgi:hypothetical protein